MRSSKIAIFDIDKTIIRSDSMFQFVHYGVRRYPGQVWRLPLIAFHTAMFKAGLMSVEQVKRSYFKSIERMTEQDLEHFLKPDCGLPFLQRPVLKCSIARKRVIMCCW